MRLYLPSIVFACALPASAQVVHMFNGPADMVCSPSSGTSGASSSGAGSTDAPPASSGGAKSSSGSSSTGGAGSAAKGGTGPDGLPATAGLVSAYDDGWWMWWEHAKTEFLAPNRLTPSDLVATNAGPRDTLRDALEAARRELAPGLREATRDPEAIQRAAACIALARTAGAEAMPELLALLADPNLDVRHAAIIGLGLTGSPRAATPLIELARRGSPQADPLVTVSPYARPLGIAGLALLRRSGVDEPGLDLVVAGLAREASGADRDGILLAAMLHLTLVGGSALEEQALAIARDERVTPAARCRAVEALGKSKRPEARPLVEDFLFAGRLDLRRSAAMALGQLRDPSSLAALARAYREEAEPLTRGFELIAIGRLGGFEARAFLMEELRAGSRGMRRWAALALGIHGRHADDPEIAAAVRAAAKAERGADAHAAYWIASGLLSDPAAAHEIANGLATAAEPLQRAYAATALALVGDEGCAAALRAALVAERNVAVRASIAHALGVIGREEDVARIHGVLADLDEPALQGLTSTALAWHGSLASLAALEELAGSREGSRARRAASIEGLGVILSPHAPLVLGEFARAANYTVLPDWLKALLGTTV